MEWSRDPAQQEIWSGRMRRYANSDLTVSAFCERERVSVQAFYYWRRKLGTGDVGGSDTGRMSRVGRVPAPQKRDFVPIAIRNSAAIKLRLPNGAQLCFPAGDANLLSVAVAAAGKLQTPSHEDDAC